MKKIAVLLFLLCWALPVFADAQYTYRPISSAVLYRLPNYPLAGADTAREQALFASQGGGASPGDRSAL